MPLRPRKCWGKKVTLTPINIVIKCIFIHVGFKVRPVNKGNQWAIPAKIPNTAPIERT